MSPLHQDRLPTEGSPVASSGRRAAASSGGTSGGPAAHAGGEAAQVEEAGAATSGPPTRSGAVARLRRHRPMPRRRPAPYLAAALAGVLLIGPITGDEGPAQAQPTSEGRSVGVAERLGLDDDVAAAGEIPLDTAAERLEDLAASRTERVAEQGRAAQAQADADRVAAEAAAAAAAQAARPEAVLPVPGSRLTSTFGARWGTLHAGIDLAAPMLTPEYAAMGGVVLEAGPASGFGNVVHIQHENRDVTVYGHMEEILVSAGQVVAAGDTIALLGNRGQSSGPHLHFEVRVGGLDGPRIDPLPWLRERGVDI